MENYELYHHGVLGQKWGVRRYQNPDGTLTAAGKRINRKIRSTSSYSNNASRYISKNGAYNMTKAEKSRKNVEKKLGKFDSKDQKAIKKMDSYKEMNQEYKMAAKNYIKKTRSEKVLDVVTDTTITAGLNFATTMAGIPLVLFTYSNTANNYKVNPAVIQKNNK